MEDLYALIDGWKGFRDPPDPIRAAHDSYGLSRVEISHILRTKPQWLWLTTYMTFACGCDSPIIDALTHTMPIYPVIVSLNYTNTAIKVHALYFTGDECSIIYFPSEPYRGLSTRITRLGNDLQPLWGAITDYLLISNFEKQIVVYESNM